MKTMFAAAAGTWVKRGLFFLFIALLSMPVFAQSTSLAGTWQLIGADKILPDGKQVPDYGTDPQGIAIFTANGQYMLEIFRSDRMPFASGDRANATPEEYKSAVMSTSCHFGTYSVDMMKHVITFHIDRATFPNWDKSSRNSSYMLRGDTLTWRVPPRPDGSIPVSVFKRVH